MSCSNYVTMLMGVELRDAEKASLAKKRFMSEFKDSRAFDLLLTPAGDIHLQAADFEVYDSFFDQLEAAHAWFQREFSIGITGYFVNECENQKFRGELTDEGKVAWIYIDWLLDYSIKDIRGLQEYAKKQMKPSLGPTQPQEVPDASV